MKTLVFNFLHPVKGIANLVPLEPAGDEQHIEFDSKSINTIEVPVMFVKRVNGR